MKNILLYKLTLANVLAVLWLLGTDYQTGWFTSMILFDTSHVSKIIIGLFVVVSLITAYKAWVVNRQFNERYSPTHLDAMPLLGQSRMFEIEWIERSAGWMLMLGLIGTLLGLQMSLAGFNTGNLADLNGIKTLASQMIGGLRVEISTTIVGAMFALWTEVNYSMISTVAKKITYEEECSGL